jgi:hypothetical protein
MKLLAMFIAPDGDELADSDSRLKFEKRGPGAARNSSAVLQVGLMIMEEIKAGKTVEDGVALAAEYFRLKERQVKTYWSRFQKMYRSGFEALEASRNDNAEADD